MSDGKVTAVNLGGFRKTLPRRTSCGRCSADAEGFACGCTSAARHTSTNARCTEARRHCGWAACSAAAVVPLAHLRMVLVKASKSSGFLK